LSGINQYIILTIAFTTNFYFKKFKKWCFYENQFHFF